LPSRRVLVSTNLAKAFPKLNTTTNIKEVYTNLSQSIAEILLMFVDRFDIDKAILNYDESVAKLEELADTKRGIVVVTAHFSNWELAAQFLAKHSLPMIAVGREGENKLIDTKITIPFREKYGNKAVYKDNAMISMAKRLKSGGNVGMLIDQAIGGTHSARVEFFGRKTSTTLSVASLKLKFDPLIVPISVTRVSKGKYKLHIDEPIEYNASELNDEREKLEAMTLHYNKAIETMIHRSPLEWFWVHNRWKH
jgi:KDO2-lipid IV(A) lauroyltransferase